MFKFRNLPDMGSVLIGSLGTELLLPQTTPGQLEYFHNGDKMTINTATGELHWEPIEPGSFTSSRLAFRLHQWFAKGIIQAIDNNR